MGKDIIPIFVLGTPRSGTTVIGKYISTHKDILDMGEYAGFDFTYRVAPNLMKTLPSNFKDEYLLSLQNHATQFAHQMAIKNNCHYFCDSTPWTLLAMDKIKDKLPRAKFVLCIREPQGVIQSLERSFKSGRKWAGKNNQERFKLWKDFYEKVKFIPQKDLIVFNYSHFCKKPEQELSLLDQQLFAHGITPTSLDKTIFAETHATVVSDHRPVSARVDNNGHITLLAREDWNNEKWTIQDEMMLQTDNEYKEILNLLKNIPLKNSLHPAVIYKNKYLSSLTQNVNMVTNLKDNIR